MKQIHERAWKWSPSTKVTHGRNRESFVTFLPVSPLLARGEFSRALTYFARSTIPKKKLGTIRSGAQLLKKEVRANGLEIACLTKHLFSTLIKRVTEKENSC